LSILIFFKPMNKTQSVDIRNLLFRYTLSKQKLRKVVCIIEHHPQSQFVILIWGSLNLFFSYLSLIVQTFVVFFLLKMLGGKAAIFMTSCFQRFKRCSDLSTYL